jgi:hypothetical protein
LAKKFINMQQMKFFSHLHKKTGGGGEKR